MTNSGLHDGTTVYYYNGWQIVETRDGSGNLTMQAYNGTQYIDELIGLRLPHGQVYVHQDANWNVTSLTDLSGKVLEQYYYSPYGELEVVAETYFGDYNADGKVDATDAANLCTNGCTCSFTSSVSGDCRVFDFDCDRDLDSSDQDTLRSLYTGLSAAMQNRRVPSLAFSPAANYFAHQGLVFDIDIHSYQNRARQYNARLKRFTQRDPLACRPHARAGYLDGANLYQYETGNPIRHFDPLGLIIMFNNCHCWAQKEAKDNKWLNPLPNCPCHEVDTLFDSSAGWKWEGRNPFHPGAYACYRAPSGDPNSRSGQQCCYDLDGRLITGGTAAGTPDKVSPEKSSWDHFWEDVWPGIRCPWNDYARARPPNNGRNCPQLSIGTSVLLGAGMIN